MPLNEINVEELYKKDSNLKKEDVKSLQEWAAMQPHLPKITELQFALFLHSCKYSNELTKNTIDIFFTVRTMCPDILGIQNVNDALIQQGINTVLMYPFPQLTPSGDLVILVKTIDGNPDHYNFGIQVKLFDTITLLKYHECGPANGAIILIDLKNIVFGHFLKMNIIVMKKFLYYLQEGMHIKLKSIQYFNIVSFMDKILNLIKPFMKKELFDAIILHHDMDSVFKQIPQELFPQDYGGNLESTQILHEKYKLAINGNVEFFNFQNSQTVDESKRPGKPKTSGDIFGVEGTFKKLEVD